MFKISIAGCGGIANVHAQIVNKLSNATLISCCDEKAAAAANFAEKYGGKSYNSLKNLIDDEKPDILHICAPHYAHVPLALYAVSRGIHVVLEKPAATTESGLHVLQNEAENAGVQVGICFQNRYNESVIYTKNLIESGKTGKILGANASVIWGRATEYYSESDWRGSINTEGAGVLINQAIHTVDLLYYLLGDPVKIAGSAANRFFHGVNNVEDTAEAVFYYANGSRVFFYATTGNCRDNPIRIEIICEKMTILIVGDELTIMRDGQLDKPKFDEKEMMGKLYWGTGHASLISDFYSCVTENRPFEIDVEEGGRSLKGVLAILKGFSK